MANFEAVKIIQSILPDLTKKVADNDPEFKNLTDQQQAARLYMSPLLPAWMRSIRDTNLLFTYFLREPVAKPSSFDRSKDFALHLEEYKEKEDKFSVKLSLEGITDQILDECPQVKTLRNEMFVKDNKHFSFGRNVLLAHYATFFRLFNDASCENLFD